MSHEVTLEQARAAKAKALEALHDSPARAGVGITSVGAGYGVKINLTETVERLPSEIEGVPVIVEVVGTISKR